MEKTRRKIIIKIVIAVICIVALIAAMLGGFWVFQNNLAEKYTFEEFSGQKGGDRIHFLNTGNSDAILLESDGKFALIDCGEDSDNPRRFKSLDLDGYEDFVVDYLNYFCKDKSGQINLEFIMGTHSHSDHIGGFDTVIMQDNVHIKKAYFKKYYEDRIIEEEVEDWDNKEMYEDVISAVNEKEIELIQDLTDVSFKFGSFNITVFNGEEPKEGEKVGENENSLAVLVEKDGYRVMLSGDLNNLDGDEERIAPEVGKVDVLKLGHHGYSHSSTKNYIDTLSPDFAIQTTGNPANFSVIYNVSLTHKAPIYSTVKHNGIILDLSDVSNVKLIDNVNI